MQANTSQVTTVTNSDGATITAAHPKFDAVMNVIEALIPVALAGASPFLKSGNAQTIAVSETPIAQALLAALSKL